MPNGPRRKGRQLSPEEKWQVFLEVTSQQLSQADAARKWGVDASTVIKLRRLAKDGALAAFAASRPGRPASIEQVEIEELRAENAREVYPNVVDGLEREGGVPSRLIKTDRRKAEKEGTPWLMFAASRSSATRMTSWPRSMGSRARARVG